MSLVLGDRGWKPNELSIPSNCNNFTGSSCCSRRKCFVCICTRICLWTN